MSVTWEPPPERQWNTPLKKGWSTKWYDRLAPLMEQPGEWGIAYTEDARQPRSSMSTVVAQLNGHPGRLNLPPGKWEACSRTIGDERRLYARYLGPDAADDPSCVAEWLTCSQCDATARHPRGEGK